MSTRDDAPEGGFEELDAETVEDLDAEEEAEDVAGGTSLNCRGGVQ